MTLTSVIFKNRTFNLIASGLLLASCSSSRGPLSISLNQFKDCNELATYYQAVQENNLRYAERLSSGIPTNGGAPNNQSAENDRSSTNPSAGLQEGDIVKLENGVLITQQYGKVHLVNTTNPAAMTILKTLDYSLDNQTFLHQMATANGRLYVVGSTYNSSAQVFIDVYNLTAPFAKVASHQIDATGFEQLRVSADQSKIYLLTVTSPSIVPSKTDGPSDAAADAAASLGRVVTGSVQKPSCECNQLRYVSADAVIGSPLISHVHALSTVDPAQPLSQQFSLIGVNSVLRATSESFLFAFDLNPEPAIELVASDGQDPVSAEADQPKSLIVLAKEQGSSLEVEAAGLVPGSVVSQFSMESRGNIVNVFSYVEPMFSDAIMAPEGVSGSGGADPRQQSYLTTLRVEDGLLSQIHQIAELGKGEQLFSALFGSNTAYAVTSLVSIWQDPLYSFDLSDFSAPEKTGELKIPGYTSFMEETPDGHVLGIGRDATEEGTIQGVHVSLFTNRAQLIQRRLLGNTNTFSAAVSPFPRSDGYKSYLYHAPAGLLFLPTSSGGFNFNGSFWEELDINNKVEVFRITATSIDPVASISTAHYVERVLAGSNAYFFVNQGQVLSRSLENPQTGLGTLNLPL